MDTKTDTDVVIDGKKYTISGYESNEYMQKVASHINEKISEFKQEKIYNRLGNEMKTILLAINLADDYYKAQEKIEELQREKAELEQEIFNMKHDMIDMQNQMGEISEKNSQLEEEKTESETKAIRLEAELEVSKNEIDKMSAKSKDKRHDKKK